jgi:WD40 repeat protein
LPDGRRVVSGSGDKTVRVWHLRTGSCEEVLKGHRDVSDLPFFFFFLLFLFDSLSFLFHHSLSSLTLILHQWVTSVCALPDGRRVVSGSGDKTVRVWHLRTGSCDEVLEGHRDVSDLPFFFFLLSSLILSPFCFIIPSLHLLLFFISGSRVSVPCLMVVGSCQALVTRLFVCGMWRRDLVSACWKGMNG